MDFFTWIAVGDVELHFSFMLVRNANIIERKLHQLHDYITSIIIPYM